MNLPLSSIQKPKVGGCPHGLPHGACPICSGMGGGGGAKKTSMPPPDEMTWDECFAIGQIMKAQKLAQQQRDQNLQAQMNLPVNFGAKLANFAQGINSFIPKISEFVQIIKNTMPAIIAKPLAVIANKILIPVLNVVQNMATGLQKAFNNIQQKIADISDKLAAVFGELKNSIEKKISDKFKDFKKKAWALFGIIEAKNEDDEEKEIDEKKRIFDLKMLFSNIKNSLYKEEIEKNDEN